MDDDQLNRMLDTATGEAMYAAISQAALWAILIKTGVIIKEDAREVIDSTMLVLERARETRPGGGPGAIDHALDRLNALLSQITHSPETPAG